MGSNAWDCDSIRWSGPEQERDPPSLGLRRRARWGLGAHRQHVGRSYVFLNWSDTYLVAIHSNVLGRRVDESFTEEWLLDYYRIRALRPFTLWAALRVRAATPVWAALLGSLAFVGGFAPIIQPDASPAWAACLCGQLRVDLPARHFGFTLEVLDGFRWCGRFRVDHPARHLGSTFGSVTLV